MITTLTRAADLPPDWDDVVGDNLYLRRDFLAFMESCDDCGQRYHFIRDADGRLDTVYLTYVRHRYNLAMFTTHELFVKMTFVYVPLSVTRPGIAWGTRREEALEHIRGLRGYKLMLNLPSGDYAGFATGMTCAQCVLTLRWSTFEGYLASLRSHYRHRYRKALRGSAGLRLRFLADPSEFDQQLYALYLQVVGHSRLVIETLSLEFFQGHWFDIFVLEDDAGPQGFVQLLANGEELIFEFVGLNYATSHTYDTYQRMLLEIVRYGIERGFATIDFGQTADDTKLKLGCDYTMLYAALHHSNPLLVFGARRLARHLEYKPLATGFTVFKEEIA